MTSVLVIDDEESIRDTLHILLPSFGYRVREAENGAQGLRSYQTEPADVVLLDMFMPVKDGFETLRDLLRHDPNTRVIAMTGGGMFGNFGILKTALFLGARKLLYKPITSTELHAAIEETMALPIKAKPAAFPFRMRQFRVVWQSRRERKQSLSLAPVWK